MGTTLANLCQHVLAALRRSRSDAADTITAWQ